MCVYMHAQLHPTLCDSMDCACRAPLSVGFSRQKYWRGLPRPLPGDRPNPGTKSASPASLALQVDSLPTEPPGKHILPIDSCY